VHLSSKLLPVVTCILLIFDSCQLFSFGHSADSPNSGDIRDFAVPDPAYNCWTWKFQDRFKVCWRCLADRQTDTQDRREAPHNLLHVVIVNESVTNVPTSQLLCGVGGLRNMWTGLNTPPGENSVSPKVSVYCVVNWPLNQCSCCMLLLLLCESVSPCNMHRNLRVTRKCGAGRIWTVTICGSLGPICGSVITVVLRLVLGLGLGFWLGLGSGLRIVVYKLLEKVTECGSITWLKLTNGVPPRSAFCRVHSPCELA